MNISAKMIQSKMGYHGVMTGHNEFKVSDRDHGLGVAERQGGCVPASTIVGSRAAD